MGSCYVYFCHVKRRNVKEMIIKVFKVSTAEMWTFYNKKAFRKYVIANVLCLPRQNATINELMAYLPVEDYCRVK